LNGFLQEFSDLSLSLIGSGQELDLTLRETGVLIRPFIPQRPDFIQIPLMDWNLRLYAHPSYLEKYGVPLKPTDLKNHQLLTFGSKIYLPYQDVD